jgi:hypothetical protein
MKISPELGDSRPVINLISVDLPAPLSPMRPTISLLPISRNVGFRLRTGPYDLETLLSSTIEFNFSLDFKY